MGGGRRSRAEQFRERLQPSRGEVGRLNSLSHWCNTGVAAPPEEVDEFTCEPSEPRTKTARLLGATCVKRLVLCEVCSNLCAQANACCQSDLLTGANPSQMTHESFDEPFERSIQTSKRWKTKREGRGTVGWLVGCLGVGGGCWNSDFAVWLFNSFFLPSRSSSLHLFKVL